MVWSNGAFLYNFILRYGFMLGYGGVWWNRGFY